MTTTSFIDGPPALTAAALNAAFALTQAQNFVSVGGVALRTAAQRAADSLNAIDMGLVNDGISDNTIAFLNLQTLAASTGKEIFLPAGTYMLQSTTLLAGLKAIWCVPGTAILKRIPSDTATRFMINGSPNNCLIEGLVIDGNKANNTQAGSGIVLGGYGITIKNVEIKNQLLSGNYGIGIQLINTTDRANGTESLIEQCLIHDNDGDGILLFGTMSDTSVSHNYCVNNGKTGINLAGSGALPTGQQINITISYNHCRSNGSSGINGGNFVLFATYPQQYIDINHNICGLNGSYGLACSANQCSVIGNLCYGNGVTTYLGNMLLNASVVTMALNRSFDAIGWGCDAGGCRDAIIYGNYIKGSRHHASTSGSGMNLGGSFNVAVTANRFEDNGGTNGNELGLHLNDGPGSGLWQFPWDSYNIKIMNNDFYPSSTSQYVILSTDGVSALRVEENSFTGAGDTQIIYPNAAAACIKNNKRTADFGGATVSVGSTTVYPDFTDTIVLGTSGALSINRIMSNLQFAYDGKVSSVKFTNRGGPTYSGAVTCTISGDGIGATAIVYLGDPVSPCGLGSVVVTNPGGGYTAATAAFSGSGTAAADVYIGLNNMMDGQEKIVVNGSGSSQTIVNGPYIVTKSGANVVLANGSALKFFVNNGGIFYEI